MTKQRTDEVKCTKCGRIFIVKSSQESDTGYMNYYPEECPGCCSGLEDWELHNEERDAEHKLEEGI